MLVDGFLNLNKPLNFTSHDCVAKVRRSLNLKRVGHAGTLDPAATGVLPIALGRATRLLQFLPSDKAYRATIRFGIVTDTDDLAGEVVRSQPTPNLTLEEVQQALTAFQGKILQIPPSYSAVQVQGKRLYDLARQGKAIAVQPREVEIFQIEVLAWRPGDFPELELAIACGGGTYIRAIARDLGETLGTGGTLAALTRTHSSGFDLDTSLTLEELEQQRGQFQPAIPEKALQHLTSIVLAAPEAKRWCQGQRIRMPSEQPALLQRPLRIHHENGAFLGIGQLSHFEADLVLSSHVVLHSPESANEAR